MAITKIILQQMVTMDQNSITASKYPKYTVVLGNTISSITAGELTSAIESSKASAAAAKQSEINAKQSELNAKDSENEAEISSTSSQQSATQSASSATASANSAKAAKTSETNAKASETAAKTSETNAKASETAAKTSETNASSSKTAAAASASAAKISETNAKQSELNAKDSENEAEISAASSQQSATQSATSETNAKASETAAKTSETNAKASETAAKTSETNAKASETAAAASAAAAKASETNAAASASAAKTSETNAASSAESASDSKGFRDEAEIFATQAAADAASAKNSETAAKTSETNAKASETATKQAQTEAEESANTASAAVITINQIKVDTQKIKDDAVAETTALKNTAVTAASTATDMATQAEQGAATSTSKADIATQKASDAEAAAARAEQAASGTLKKDQNLADVANINTARTNLKVDKVVQGASYSDFLSANGAMRLRVQDNNTWGGWNGDWIALAIGNGGTGAKTVSDARNNFGLGQAQSVTFGGLISDGTHGVFAKGRNITSGSSFVSQYYDESGTLKCQGEFRSDVNGNITIINRGLTSSDATYFNVFQRDGYFNPSNLILGSSASNPMIIKSAHPCIKFEETDVTQNNNWFMVLDGGGLRINKDSTGGSVAYLFKPSGKFEATGGYETQPNVNWNGLNNPINRTAFISGQANAPVDLMHGGIHVGYSDSYAMQIAARDNGFHGRCLENGSWKEWKKFALENTDIVNFSAAGYTADAIYSTKAISFVNGSTTYNLPVTYGVLAGFGNGVTTAAGCYVGQLCWQKADGALFTRVRDDGSRVWRDWLKVTTAAVSDENLKDIKGNLNVEGALDNINRMEFKLFRYLKDSPERSARRGVIAQQVRNIDREYTTKVGDQLHLDTTPMLLDGLAAIQALTKRDQENKERISTLEKEVEELKDLVNKLVNTDNLA